MIRAIRLASLNICGGAFFFCALFGIAGPAAAIPDVVVSVKPLHSIVAGVMGDVAVPSLLMDRAESPHSFALRPSQARKLQAANIVFWVGPAFERPLVSALKTLAKDAEQVELGKSVRLLPYRSQGIWLTERHEHGHGDHGHGASKHGRKPDGHGHEHKHKHGTQDPHFWLDPIRVRALVPHIERALSTSDPANAAQYRDNAARLKQRLSDLDRRLKSVLTPVGEVPFLVFHDAYQYLETRYHLKAAGTVTLNPEVKPGAKHLTALRKTVRHNKVRCVFREPQFSPSLIKVVANAVDVKVGVLDPIGAKFEPGSDAYFQTMEDLAKNLANCLKM